MIIYEVNLTKAGLGRLTRSERNLLFLIGHISNELAVLQKLILMMRQPGQNERRVVVWVEAGQIMILFRYLVGKIHEGWDLFKARIDGNEPFKGKYLSNLDPEARAALERLRSEFETNDRESPLTSIRNMTFHNEDKDGLVEKAFHELSASEGWAFYLSDATGNTFYYASELVMTRATLQFTEHDIAKLVDLALYRARDLARLMGAIIAEIIGKRFQDVFADEIDIGPAQKLSEMRVPYFLDDDDLRLQRAKAKSGS